MGCCSSKDEETTPVAPSKANERTPLLHPTSQPHYEEHSAQQEKDRAQAEREALKIVVQKASDNLINITSTESVARMNGHESNARAEAFKKIINHSPVTKPVLLPTPSKYVDPSSLGSLLTSPGVSQEDQEKLIKQTGAISDAIKGIKVKDVGPLIQSLPEL